MADVYETKDSGKRAEFGNDFVRDTSEGKPRFDLLLPDGIPFSDQFLTRIAELMERGAKKYDERNWERARGEEALNRFKESALRHLLEWYCDAADGEDHAASVFFNLMGAEFVKWHLENVFVFTQGVGGAGGGGSVWVAGGGGNSGDRSGASGGNGKPYGYNSD